MPPGCASAIRDGHRFAEGKGGWGPFLSPGEKGRLCDLDARQAVAGDGQRGQALFDALAHEVG
jgi:hypothetical protein